MLGQLKVGLNRLLPAAKGKWGGHLPSQMSYAMDDIVEQHDTGAGANPYCASYQ